MPRLHHWLGFAAIASGLLLGIPAQAQAPAVAALQGDERARMEADIKAARSEGMVTYIDGVFAAETVNDIAAAFRKHYGLPNSFAVNYTHGNTSAIVTRMEQELAAGRVTADVIGLAAPSWVFARATAGDIMQYESPEYAHYHRVFDQGMGKDGYFAMNGAYFFVPSWNADTLDFKGTSWNDVIGAVPAGRINMGNAETSLANLVTFMGVSKTIGQDFYVKLAAMRPQIVTAGEGAHDRLLSGEDLMSMYGQATHLKYRNELGAHLKMMIPKEGLVLLPQDLFILAKAPHPAASRLLLDFLLSEQGQAIIVDKEALISGRDGAPSPMPEYALQLETVPTIKIDWANTTAADLAKARAEWKKIFE